MAFLNFMVSPAGRLLRSVVGIVLIVVGLLGIGGTGGIVVSARVRRERVIAVLSGRDEAEVLILPSHGRLLDRSLL